MKRMKPTKPDVMRPQWGWGRGPLAQQVANAAPTGAQFTIKAKGSGVIPVPEAAGDGIFDRPGIFVLGRRR